MVSAELSAARIRALRETLDTDAVLLEGPRLEEYAGDRSAAEPVIPAAVCLPASPADVAALIATCAREGIPVTARGAGTGKAGGCVPASGGVVCSLERLLGVTRVSAADQQAEVLAGTVTGDLRARVEREGLFYPPDPASLDECSVGGNVATNAGGPLCVKYGVTGDYVLGLDAVLADGRPVRLGRRAIKGVAGYDLRALMVGSEGTLGVITSVTLRLLPLPAEVRAAWITFENAVEACEGVLSILGAGVLPRALELMDATALRGAARGAALLLEVDGPSWTCEPQMARALDAVAGRAATVRVAETPAESDALWELRRKTSDAIKEPFAHHLSEDVAVPTGQVAELLRRLEDIGAAAPDLTVAAYGHAGDGNLHVNLLYDSADLTPLVRGVSEQVFRAALDLGGTVTGEHGIGLLKRDYLGWELPPPAMDLQRAVKQALDPEGILNPGKVI